MRGEVERSLKKKDEKNDFVKVNMPLQSEGLPLCLRASLHNEYISDLSFDTFQGIESYPKTTHHGFYRQQDNLGLCKQ